MYLGLLGDGEPGKGEESPGEGRELAVTGTPTKHHRPALRET